MSSINEFMCSLSHRRRHHHHKHMTYIIQTRLKNIKVLYIHDMRYTFDAKTNKLC